MMFLRQLISIVILPFAAAVMVPLWLIKARDVALQPPATAIEFLAVALGLLLLSGGLWLFTSSVRRFARDGDGTLAPWDPPRRFVVTGPYRYVRNPMISGVIFILLGEAALLWSRPHLAWALIFIAANAVFIPVFEEPQLRARFGERYEVYTRHVGRLIPRLRPWTADDH